MVAAVAAVLVMWATAPLDLLLSLLALLSLPEVLSLLSFLSRLSHILSWQYSLCNSDRHRAPAKAPATMTEPGSSPAPAGDVHVEAWVSLNVQGLGFGVAGFGVAVFRFGVWGLGSKGFLLLRLGARCPSATS